MKPMRPRKHIPFVVSDCFEQLVHGSFLHVRRRQRIDTLKRVPQDKKIVEQIRAKLAVVEAPLQAENSVLRGSEFRIPCCTVADLFPPWQVAFHVAIVVVLKLSAFTIQASVSANEGSRPV
jgi:hypothetical protein